MSQFTGEWLNTTQEGFVEMLIKLGIPDQRAKFIGASRPLLTIKMQEDKLGFHFKQELPNMGEVVTENDWLFGQEQEDVDENGKKGVTVWNLIDENTMEGKFTNEDVALPTLITRKIEGNVLRQEIKIGEIVGVRVFERK